MIWVKEFSHKCHYYFKFLLISQTQDCHKSNNYGSKNYAIKCLYNRSISPTDEVILMPNPKAPKLMKYVIIFQARTNLLFIYIIINVMESTNAKNLRRQVNKSLTINSDAQA